MEKDRLILTQSPRSISICLAGTCCFGPEAAWHTIVGILRRGVRPISLYPGKMKAGKKKVSLVACHQIFFFFNLFYFYMSSPLLSSDTPEEGLDPTTDGCEPPCGYQELNSGSLEEQSVLLTAELALQPCPRFLKSSLLSNDAYCWWSRFCSTVAFVGLLISAVAPVLLKRGLEKMGLVPAVSHCFSC